MMPSIPPNLRMVASARRGCSGAIADVDLAGIDGFGACNLGNELFGLLRGVRVLIRSDHVSAGAGKLLGVGSADAAAAADHQHDLAAEFLLRRHAPDLGFFERPVFDAKRFARRKRNVVVEAGEGRRDLGGLRLRQNAPAAGCGSRCRSQSGCSRHHMDRVDVELGSDARFLLVLARM